MVVELWWWSGGGGVVVKKDAVNCVEKDVVKVVKRGGVDG